jgi:hypothetical protein
MFIEVGCGGKTRKNESGMGLPMWQNYFWFSQLLIW